VQPFVEPANTAQRVLDQRHGRHIAGAHSGGQACDGLERRASSSFFIERHLLANPLMASNIFGH
jgi:hypothetical protein